MTYIQMNLIAIGFRLILHDYIDTVFCVTLEGSVYFIIILIYFKLIKKYVNTGKNIQSRLEIQVQSDLTDVHTDPDSATVCNVFWRNFVHKIPEIEHII